jgi:Ca2+/Na+ antiporter
MKIPKAEDIVLNSLAILSFIFILSGLVRSASGASYSLPLLYIGLILLIVFIIAISILRKKKQTATT